ncbi:MAG: 2-oxoacid:acceptor oxidoreductase family protein [Deltaproteobacteria bacterium]|nr:2-oxoacid:acceptor oxidoreductase family protein [Deltaproteobacteria bacterium]MBW2305665.1 2-oxoacid:acceptor oxidoreductase family protein [Deltaproteobacteria bacterium]
MIREIRFAGSGGQGILLAGNVLAESAAVYEGRNVARNTAYGGQVRGGASRCEVLMADNDEEIDFPQVLCADVLVAMSPEAVKEFAREVKDEGLILLDASLTGEMPDVRARVVAIPATKIADEELGQVHVANMVILGALLSLTHLVPLESAEKALIGKVPPHTVELNLKAFRRGVKAARQFESAA